MTSLPDHKIDSIGVDWITSTTPRTKNFEGFRELGMSLVEDAAKAGNDLRTWKRQGYAGYICAGVSVGWRGDSNLIQLRSDDARLSWKPVAEAAVNVSRLDLQMTYELKQAQADFLLDEHKSATAANLGRGRKRNLTLITSALTGDSVYFGQRSSDIYGRAYDKGLESKSAPKGKLIRHELEMKRDVAKSHAMKLCESPSPDMLIAGYVSSFMSRQHLRTSDNFHANRESARARSSSDNARRLRWLRSSVSRSVEVLLEAGELKAVLSSLGLLEAVGAACKSGQLKQWNRRKADDNS